MAAETVAQALERPRNAFTGFRFLLALAVVVSHAFSVTSGNALDEPLARLTGFTLGEHAVNGFFAVSGFLVTMSLDRRGARDYVVARSLRILPGLVAATLLVSLVLGAAMTRLPLAEYFRDPGLWRFIQGTLTTFKSNAALPGVFAGNPYPSPLGTVWTLKYEVLCYLGVLAAGALGLLRRRWSAAAIAAALAVALAAADASRAELPKGLETALRLPLIFSIGAALYLARERVRLPPLLLAGLVLGCVLLHGTPLYRTLLFSAEALCAVALCLAPALAVKPLDPAADLSYGIYLYGWPIQQSLHALWPAASPWALLPPALALTLLVAAASWYGIERPALRLKARALGRRTLRTVEPGGP
ncbi:acyltransferase family protein [Methylobacterium sp. sgz302541]|uniref:acyltransferase family protein n=1 Tax=unclassified Methylobacterium TaxID=2615210 RepID=UPI003D357189